MSSPNAITLYRCVKPQLPEVCGFYELTGQRDQPVRIIRKADENNCGPVMLAHGTEVTVTDNDVDIPRVLQDAFDTVYGEGAVEVDAELTEKTLMRALPVFNTPDDGSRRPPFEYFCQYPYDTEPIESVIFLEKSDRYMIVVKFRPQIVHINLVSLTADVPDPRNYTGRYQRHIEYRAKVVYLKELAAQELPRGCLAEMRGIHYVSDSWQFRQLSALADLSPEIYDNWQEGETVIQIGPLLTRPTDDGM